ncbi:MAG: DNA polymerase IV [Bacteroidota bacterium]
MIDSKRHIVHFDLDAFFVSVERILDPSLEGKPVIVGGSSERGVVSAASYEARKNGVHSAMPTRKAAQLCPEAVFVRGSIGEYSRYSRMVTELIASKVPLFEKASIDEFYIDLTGMDRFFGVYQYTKELRLQIIRETGLPISFALATNKLVGKVATNEVKPNGEIEVLPGFEKAYFSPMKLEKLPGVGGKFIETLHHFNLYTMGQVAAMEPAKLETMFGKHGYDLWYQCNAIDNRPVVSYHEPKSCSSENTFEKDTKDENFLLREITRLSEKVGYEVRAENKMSGCISIKLRYSNFETVSKQSIVDYTASDHRILASAKQLFLSLWDKETPVRLLGVRCSHLVESSYQLSLFDNADDDKKLYSAIDDIKNTFGKKLIQRAGSLQASQQPGVRPGDPLWISKNSKEV